MSKEETFNYGKGITQILVDGKWIDKKKDDDD
jgi:hypothetical protein